MSVDFTGEVHPYTAEYPLLPDDELADLAADIAENGLKRPITIDQQGRLIDGQNRLAACALAGVDPAFRVVEFSDDAAVAAFVSTENDRRRSQSPGVKWMRVGLALKRQGKRAGGRWERGAINKFVDSEPVTTARMTEVGLILDVADRAAGLGDEFQSWADLPSQVLTGQTKLGPAVKLAQQFDAHAAMAELLAFQPLAEWIGHHTELAAEASERYAEPPSVDRAWKPEHLHDLTEAASNYQRAATALRAIIKENK